MHSLYRYYSESDVLLYVGISRDPFRRFGQHQSSDKDMTEVRRVEVDWLPDKMAAQAAELKQIKDMDPKWNVLARRGYEPQPQEMTAEEIEADERRLKEIFDNLDPSKFKKRDKFYHMCGPRDGSNKKEPSE